MCQISSSLSHVNVHCVCVCVCVCVCRSRSNAISSQREVLQLGCAVMQSLELTQGQHWDEIAAVEKVCVCVCVCVYMCVYVCATNFCPCLE